MLCTRTLAGSPKPVKMVLQKPTEYKVVSKKHEKIALAVPKGEKVKLKVCQFPLQPCPIATLQPAVGLWGCSSSIAPGGDSAVGQQLLDSCRWRLDPDQSIQISGASAAGHASALLQVATGQLPGG